MGFNGESVIAPVPLALTPESVPNTVLVQLKLVPAMVEVGSKFSASPLQVLTINGADGVVITGCGFTVTVASTKLPLQPFAEGVIR